MTEIKKVNGIQNLPWTTITLRIDLQKFFKSIDESIFINFHEQSYPSVDTLIGYDLMEKDKEAKILETLKKEDRFVTVSLADIYSFMKQSTATDMRLLKRGGYSNVFFAINKYGVCCEIVAIFLDGAFHLKYFDLQYNLPWPPGRRIFGKLSKKEIPVSSL